MRYSLHTTRDNKYFQHGVQVFKMLDFHETRQWLIQTYGLSESIDKDVEYNPHWAFYMKYNHYMLYLRGNEELSWFKIRHGEQVE